MASAKAGDTAATAPMSCTQRVRRVVDIDLRFCPHCAEQLHVLAVITHPRVIATILDYRTRHASRDPPAATPLVH